MESAERAPRKPNRLATEASPYLLQHAHNPVEWWPWGPDALAEAKRRDVPILLSVGYSACHWCHVMERESFEDAAIAALMNERFVNVKVDREERPDLDQIYQLVVQVMGRSGGWPLTVFLTPSQRPFFAGTYFPPEDRHGMPGFPKVLEAIADAYRDRRDEVEGQAAEITNVIHEASRGGDPGGEPAALGTDTLERASRPLLARLDPVNGGFGRAPKFPNTMPLEVLLRRGIVDKDGPAVDAARLQLLAMERGGIWDHLGGGFHRYSTDERWLVPHFEKMLYDNALLLRAYVDGHRALHEPSFAETARRIAVWVLREMTDSEGGFYASQDADSEGEEGKFFVWNEAEVRAAVAGTPDPERIATVALEYFAITMAGNFEDHGRPTFMTVLGEARPPSAVAAKLGLREAEVKSILAEASRAMFAHREGRPRPFRDEKILTSWSSLLVSSLAEAGRALRDPSLVAAADRALRFIEKELVTERGVAVRVARLAKRVEGRFVVKSPGFLDDHAYLANAALDLYEATGEPSFVTLASGLAETILTTFTGDGAGFFFTPKDGEALITRSMDPYDNAVPSGTAIACRVLLRLGTLLDPRFTAPATRELERLAPPALANPFGYGQLLCEIDRMVRGSVDVVLVGRRSDPRTQALADEVFAHWLPNRTVAWIDPEDPATIAAAAALGEGKMAGPAPAAYVCRGRTCSLPVTSPAALRPLLTSS